MNVSISNPNGLINGIFDVNSIRTTVFRNHELSSELFLMLPLRRTAVQRQLTNNVTEIITIRHKCMHQ